MERRLGRITIAGMGVLAVAVVSCSCSGRASSPAAPPTAPSAVSAPTPAPPPPTPTPTPTPGAGPFTISLPIRPGDNRNNAFGVNPFGVHIGDHAIDGHPGWDIEYAVGATVVASADGTVQSVLPSEGSDGFGIQIRHFVAGREAYRTIYGVGTLAPGVSPGASITSGQPLGIVSSFTRTIGRITVTYGFTHFQLDDFSRNDGLTNVHAVSPESFLDSAARAQFDEIWRQAFYPQELVEPFVDNPRNVSFPMTRTWALTSGDLASRLEFTRSSAFASDYSYVMRDRTGAVVETGTTEIEALAKPTSTIDFIPNGGQRRRGVYSIVSGTMQLNYGRPADPRPASLAGASAYTTSP